MEINLKENERIDDLEFKNLKIIQNKKNFCFGIDSILLSDFAKEIKSNSKVLDLGTGTGILGILLCGKTNLSKIIGIEIQKDMCDMAQRSIDLNNLENRFEILNYDIRNIDFKLQMETFDYVVTNPPYKKIDTGIQNKEDSILIAKHEVKCNLEDIINKSFKMLKNNGTIYMVHRPDRLVDIFYLLRKYNLEPKQLRLVYSKTNEMPKLVLIKATKNSKPFLKVDKPLIIYNEDGNYTDEVLKIYNK